MLLCMCLLIEIMSIVTRITMIMCWLCL